MHLRASTPISSGRSASRHRTSASVSTGSGSATRSCTSSRRTTRRRSDITSASRSTTSSRSTCGPRSSASSIPCSPITCACSRTGTCSSTCATRAGTSSRSTAPWATTRPTTSRISSRSRSSSRRGPRTPAPGFSCELSLGGAMTAPPELLTPTSPAEAAAAFGDGAGVTVMGGGTILLPELTYGRLRPERVLMIGRAGLSGVDNSNGVVRIGATTPVGELQDAPEPLVTAAKHVADHEIRAVGTIGGNLCATAGQAAPRGDLQAPLLALGARITSVGAGGEQTEDVEAFLESGSGRLVLSIDVPSGQPFGYARLDRPHTHHYTMLAVTAVRGADGVRVAASGVGDRSQRLTGVEKAMAGGASAADAAGHAGEGLELPTDALASSWYREQMLPLLVERALGQLG